jgi:dihydrolipoyl dehydrogenase
MAKEFDLIVIGGGPGGYVAAIRAAQLGMKTCVVEKADLGGICLNWGCVPTKALLRSSELRHMIEGAAAFGIKAKLEGVDVKKAVERSRQVAKTHSEGVAFLMKKNKIEVIYGEATLAKGPKVAVKTKEGKGEDLSAKNVIIATGARARELGALKADGKHVWSYREAMVPGEIPASLLVVGSGAIGMEFASFFSDMGSKVKVIEVLERILPQEDEEVSKMAERIFKKQGIEIETAATVESLKVEGGKVKAKIKGKSASEAIFDKVILAIGIAGNVENLGLEAAGVKVDKGHIVTDQWGFTGVDGFWAIGDVAGPPWLAHKASHEGVIAVEKIAGHGPLHALDKSNVPSCTYCRPQVASVGLTEAKAREGGREVKVGKYPFTANAKATVIGEREGFIKTVFDAKTGELLGAHMIGPDVTELIQGFVIAKTLETTEAELMAAIFPHPTLSEAMGESVLAAYGRALHI